MTQQLVKVSLQLEPAIAKALDEWQRQRFVRSRSSAANQLLAQALGLASMPPSAPSAPATPKAMPVGAPPTAPTFAPPAIPTPGTTGLSGWGN